MSELREAIRQLAGTQFDIGVNVALAEVISVDSDNATCVCQLINGITTAEQKTVSLMADNDDGLLIIPSIGSTVIVAWTKRMLPYIAMFSEIQDVFLDASGIIQMNQGVFGGLVKVQDLVARLNNIENAFNALNAKVNGLAPTPIIPNVPLTNRSDLENTNITHG